MLIQCRIVKNNNEGSLFLNAITYIILFIILMFDFSQMELFRLLACIYDGIPSFVWRMDRTIVGLFDVSQRIGSGMWSKNSYLLSIQDQVTEMKCLLTFFFYIAVEVLYYIFANLSLRKLHCIESFPGFAAQQFQYRRAQGSTRCMLTNCFPYLSVYLLWLWASKCISFEWYQVIPVPAYFFRISKHFK